MIQGLDTKMENALRQENARITRVEDETGIEFPVFLSKIRMSHYPTIGYYLVSPKVGISWN